MTPEEKVALLKEAGVWDVIGFPTCIDKLFDLVAKHERENLRCAIILNDDGGTYSTHESKEQLEWMLNMSPAKEVIEAAVLAEREACAKVCDENAKRYQIAGMMVADECAAAIRARGKK